MVAVFAGGLVFLLNQQEKTTTPHEEKADWQPEEEKGWVWADPEEILSPLPPGGIRVISGSLPSDNQTKPKEEEAEVDPKEAKRLANWKANFPYKPTTDPDVVIPEEMLKNYGRRRLYRNS